MPNSLFMVITDQTGALVPGESTATVRNPYTNAVVTFPIEITAFSGDTTNAVPIGSGGGGSSKIVFNPFTISKKVDKASQTLFITHAKGITWRFVDILVVKSNADGSLSRDAKPFLSYRLGTVAVTEIATSVEEETRENVSFAFGQLQIGYQIQKADGSLTAFAPVGWDRIRNVQI